MNNELWFHKSFNKQMAEIGANIRRTICIWRMELKKEKQELLPYEYEEAKAVKELFKLSKEDPKNAGVVREIEKAEEAIDYFWSMVGCVEEDEWNRNAEEILNYWKQFKHAFNAEIVSYSKKFFFLVRGHREWNDTYEWIGIYDDVEKLKEAYERALTKLAKEREKYEGLRDDEDVLIYFFDTAEEIEGEMIYREVQVKELW